MRPGTSADLLITAVDGRGVIRSVSMSVIYEALFRASPGVLNAGGDTVFGWSNPAQGPINITPPTSTSGGSWPTGTTSATYNGISMWVPRSYTSELHLISSYNITMPGTWYAVGGEFDIRPNGATTVFNLGSYICALAEWGQGYNNSTNKSNGTINLNPGTSAPHFRPTLVE